MDSKGGFQGAGEAPDLAWVAVFGEGVSKETAVTLKSEAQVPRG